MKYSARSLVESILRYFDIHLRMRGTLLTRYHWEDCWQLVAEAFYGKFVLPRLPIETPVYETAPARTGPPMRPLRKVVERRLRRGVVYYILECGHELQDILATVDEPCPKHRRCKECRVIQKGRAA